MIATILFGLLTLISLCLTLWQVWVAWRFPLHQRLAGLAFAPAVTILKPIKGATRETANCLRSWLTQEYDGAVQVLFGVASAEDPACGLVQELIAQHPDCEAQLLICRESIGTNGKVSTLIQLARQARHDHLIISDADVRVPPDLVAQVVAPMREPGVGLVSCFYRLVNPSNLAMRWEAVAVNADFWSQVLMSRSLRPLDYALGAVMATTRRHIDGMGGLGVLADYLADDYQLGHRIAQGGAQVVLSPVVVDCVAPPMDWRQVWRHQLRWARTIRFCKPLPYALSLLSNATLWPWLWLATAPRASVLFAALFCLLVRVLVAQALQARLTLSSDHFRFGWMIPVKDLLQAALWAGAFLGDRIEWRGDHFQIQSNGKLIDAEMQKGHD